VTPQGDWWVYIVRCADDTLYVGVARHLAARIRQHNTDDRLGARYTRGRRPVTLFIAAPCADRRAAARLEWQTKQLPRAQKLALGAAPGWLPGPLALLSAAATDDPGPNAEELS
jgi:putative endonuclease